MGTKSICQRTVKRFNHLNILKLRRCKYVNLERLPCSWDSQSAVIPRGFQGLLKEFKYKVAVGKVNIG